MQYTCFTQNFSDDPNYGPMNGGKRNIAIDPATKIKIPPSQGKNKHPIPKDAINRIRGDPSHGAPPFGKNMPSMTNPMGVKQHSQQNLAYTKPRLEKWKPATN